MLIQRGDGSKFNVETLKQLLKLLPEKHEVGVWHSEQVRLRVGPGLGL